MKKGKVITNWLYWFTFAVAVIVIYKTLDNLTDITNWLGNLFSILMPFVVGIILAYLFYIPCKKVENAFRKSKLKLSNKWIRYLSILSVYIIAILVLVIIINFILPTLSKSIVDLASNLPSYYSRAKDYIEELPEESILNKIDIKGIVSSLEKINVKALFTIENIGGYIKGAVGVVSTIFSIIVTTIVSIYVLAARHEIVEFIKKLFVAIFKDKKSKKAIYYFEKTNEIFFKFIASQFLDAVIIGIITSIAMSILGVKYAILLGFMIGLFNVIPYFGAIIAIFIAGLITLFTGGFGQMAVMLIIVIILQQLDANIINPKIIGNSLKINPLLVIFAVTVGGAYFGVLGMLLGVPVIAVIKLWITDYIEEQQIS